jgi:hypothetical protein
LLLLTTLAACRPAANSNTSVTLEAMQARLARVDEFAWHGPLFIHSELLESVRSLGPLLQEEIKTAPNQHDPSQLDEFRTLIFDGLELYGWVAPAELFKPIRVVVTTSQWQIRDDLDVGTSAARIEKALGPPTEAKGGMLRYEGETERVNFYVRGNEIAKVEFLYYLD